MSIELFRLCGKRVWVAGHKGMVGSALVRQLAGEDCEILTADRRGLDLRDGGEVGAWIRRERPDAIFLAAATVGGILANNDFPAQFLYDNLMIESNVIHAAYGAGVAKLLFLGSSCIYPRMAPQPIPEEALMTGPLEATNEWYAIAKIAGIKLAQAYRKQYGADFISAMPTNLYGPGDNFNLVTSHVLPALLRKVHEAKRHQAPDVVLWGTGRPLREFMHVDDCASACVYLMKNYSGYGHVNVGSGEEISIADLAQMIMEIVGYQGGITFDPGKPDGTPRKLLDSARLRSIGWHPKVSLREGLLSTYNWYLSTFDSQAYSD